MGGIEKPEPPTLYRLGRRLRRALTALTEEFYRRC